jgi:hypothetical protein
MRWNLRPTVSGMICFVDCRRVPDRVPRRTPPNHSYGAPTPQRRPAYILNGPNLVPQQWGTHFG